MSTIKKIIEKFADLAKKVILVGALVGGVSLMANATEKAVGPTLEKAQLETVSISLDVVVAAITKVDPNWVKRLPVVNRKGKVQMQLHGVLSYVPGSGSTPGRYYVTTSTVTSGGGACGGLSIPCKIQLSPDDLNTDTEGTFIKDDAPFTIEESAGPYSN